MICPSCGQTMQEETLSGLQVDRCEQCPMMWFDKDELDKLRARATGKKLTPTSLFIQDAARQYPRCPRCERNTLRVGRCHDLPMMKCKLCEGLAVDSSELESLVSLWKQRGQRYPVARRRKDSSVISKGILGLDLMDLGWDLFDL